MRLDEVTIGEFKISEICTSILTRALHTPCWLVRTARANRI